MGIKGSGSSAVFWQTQLPVDFLDNSLTINDWSEVSADLSSGRPARLWYIVIEQTNNGATAEDIELEITINGTAYTWTQTCDSGTQYYCTIREMLDTGDFDTYVTTVVKPVAGIGTEADQTMPFTARSVGLIRVRQTTDVDGTSAQIEVNIAWDKLQGL